jgi:class 3 adenylate cyclase/alpha-beta hydrolase superfamily lysophospholipase
MGLSGLPAVLNSRRSIGGTIPTQPPEVLFTRSDTVDLAYQIVGDGPIDIVLIVGWASHLEVLWELPEARRFIDRLAAMGRLIMFDKRGTGLSDRPSEASSIEEMVPDVVAVMDAAGVGRAAIVGWSDGAAMAMRLAALHPDRVNALVPAEALATATSDEDHPWGPDPQMLEGLASAIEMGMWGQAAVLSVLAPSVAEDPRIVEWFQKLERMSATPHMAADLLRRTLTIDTRPFLSAITVPCLLLHRAEAVLIPSEGMRWLADNLPDGRYIELPGDALPGYLGDVDGLMDEIEDFLVGTRTGAAIDRKVTTVMFSDVVGSTERVVSVGDRQWHGLLESHRTQARGLLARYGGREIGTAGDGFLIAFDSPTSAIQCALELSSTSKEAGLEVRIGLHSGEVVFDGNDVSGLAVHIGARVAGMAAPDQVVVSKTTRDMVIGSPFRFASLGEHELKGVPGLWELFRLDG